MSTPTGHWDDPVDLIVIGGGINGAGIARDAAQRGLSVVLFERSDFGAGATGNSSGMIHGGIRYLLNDPEVTRLACLDSGYIQKIAQHLIFRIPFVMPMRGTSILRKTYITLTEMYFEVYDRYQPLKQGKPHCRLTGEEIHQIVPGLDPTVAGAVTTDEWGIDSYRLNLINAMDAAEFGAELNTYHEVIALLRGDNGEIRGVKVRDRLSGAVEERFGKVVLNAAGAWATKVFGLTSQHKDLVRPGKGIHVVYPGRLTNYAIIAKAIDGRQIFICPHQNETWIGTTDDDYWGDLDDIEILEDEVKYLVDGVANIFPAVLKHRISRLTVGCRPTIYAYGPTESALSRDHMLHDHRTDGAPNLFSLTGGKLASYRIISEEV
ncbi:MAG: FAD-dependent oxidoreductase, partial [Myxococcales bacterium]|nr:FAD-dependent oxidoreductase [Myxococcales bacterium]